MPEHFARCPVCDRRTVHVAPLTGLLVEHRTRSHGRGKSHRRGKHCSGSGKAALVVSVA